MAGGEEGVFDRQPSIIKLFIKDTSAICSSLVALDGGSSGVQKEHPWTARGGVFATFQCLFSPIVHQMWLASLCQQQRLVALQRVVHVQMA